MEGDQKMDPNDWTLTGNANIDPSTNFLGTTDDHPLVFKTRGIEAMRIAPVGNIGIGTETPDFRLHIETGNQLNLAVKSPDESVGAGIQLQCQRGWELLATGGAAAQGASKFNLRDLATGKDVLTVNGEQNDTVGIGTTVPEATLHVASGNDFHTPQVEIEQTKASDFARLRFVSYGTNPDPPHRQRDPLWDIAAGLG